MLEASRTHSEERRRLAAATIQAASRAWANVSPDSVDATWRGPSRRLVAALTILQRRAASEGAGYIAAALAEQGVLAAPVARVGVDRLAGVASDGRPLLTLLDQPAIRTKRLLSDGMEPLEALAAGGRNLRMLSVTQVQDAGRTAESLAIVARRDINWVRRLRGSSCSRCSALADKAFRWNAGFARHPGCDCYHEPALRSGTPSAAEGDGLRVAGTSSREGRSMPEQIYSEASDRAEAVRMLARLGYLQT